MESADLGLMRFMGQASRLLGWPEVIQSSMVLLTVAMEGLMEYMGMTGLHLERSLAVCPLMVGATTPAAESLMAVDMVAWATAFDIWSKCTFSVFL